MRKSDWARIDQEWRGCKRAILAYHLGGWREGESPLEALARAPEPHLQSRLRTLQRTMSGVSKPAIAAPATAAAISLTTGNNWSKISKLSATTNSPTSRL